MKVLIAFDSQYGNTQKVAEVIAKVFQQKDVELLRVDKTNLSKLKGVQLLIVGSPTRGGRPTEAVQRLLNNIPAGGLNGIRIATFDTRFAENDHGTGLQLLMRVIGFAAPKIAKTLENKGGSLIAPPQGFIVADKEGPLKKGELEIAKNWAGNIKHTL